LDSDVIPDWLANRKPWDAAATEIIERAILGDWALWFSPLTLANVHYIYRKHSGNAEALTAIQTLAKIGNIATMDSGHVMRALASGQADFEDELQIASASALPELTSIDHPQPTKLNGGVSSIRLNQELFFIFFGTRFRAR
jgi:predicted nucleic acid-binding protein